MRYRELFPEAVERELAEARQLAEHRVTLLGHTTEHGKTIAWSRDPVSGRDWPRGFSPDIPYRGVERLGDIKLPWELNKHQYFFTMGKAAWLSGDDALAAEIAHQIDHWIDDNPCLRGIHWISALEVGARAISWIMAWPFYADCCDERLRRRLISSLAQQMLFVEQHLSTGRFANTHLVGEAAALVAGGLFLDCRHSARWLATGLRILDEEIGRQVTADGVHAERSVEYHRFFLDQYYLIAALLAANRRSLSPATLARMEQMTTFLMHVLFPDGTAPAFGDGDQARGLWLHADGPGDYAGLLALGAVLFGREDFKAAAGRVTEEVFWLRGVAGVAAFESLAARFPGDTSVAYAAGGYYVMRGGWGAADPVLVFDCGALGYGPAGHGHADALSFQLHAAGYPFLVDAGTFSYNLDYAWRDVFRGTHAHNTVVVDGQDQSIPGDRISWKSAAVSRPQRWVTTQWFDLADGEHDGYGRLLDPVTHRRVVFFVKPDLWVIWDDLRARDRHEIELLMHVMPNCRVDVEPETGGAVLTSPEGGRLTVRVCGEGHDERRIDVLAGTEEERGAWFSPGYGVRSPSRTLRVTREFDGQCSLVTCLSTSAGARPVITPRQGAMGIRLEYGDGSETNLSYVTDGARPPHPEGVHFDGTLLFHRQVRDGSAVVYASRFQDLALDGLLEVRAPVPIETLVLEHDRCVVTLDQNHAGGLDFKARKGVRLVVNGRPSEIASPVIRPAMVSS